MHLWGAAAPAIPILVDLLIDVLALLGWIVCLGLLWAWRHTIGAGLRAVASSLDIHILGKTIPIGSALRALDDTVTSELSAWAFTTHAALGRFWLAAAKLTKWAADEIASVATDTYRYAERLEKRYLPHYVRWAIAGAFAGPLLTLLIARELKKLIPQLAHIAHGAAVKVEVILDRPAINRLEHEIAALRRWTRTHAGHAAVAATGAIAADLPHVFVFPRLKRLELDGLKLRRRLKRLEKILGAAGAAAIMANALGLGNNWRCITRGNIGKVARRLCGIGPAALEDLLGLLADVLILQNICTVITVLEDGFKLIEPEMTEFIKTAEAQFVHCKYRLPTIPAIALPYLPPVTGVVLNQAA